MVVFCKEKMLIVGSTQWLFQMAAGKCAELAKKFKIYQVFSFHKFPRPLPTILGVGIIVCTLVVGVHVFVL